MDNPVNNKNFYGFSEHAEVTNIGSDEGVNKKIQANSERKTEARFNGSSLLSTLIVNFCRFI